MAVAVFLDKDGTLVPNIPYNVRPELIDLAAGAARALPALAGAGYELIVVSNQSGVARGLFPEEALTAVHSRVSALVAEAGAPLAGFYYCPHAADAACGCRKPSPGLIRQAAAERDLDLTRCWLVGDILDDVEAGRRAGCGTILIDNGGETEWRQDSPFRQPHAVVRDLAEAAQVILGPVSHWERGVFP